MADRSDGARSTPWEENGGNEPPLLSVIVPAHGLKPGLEEALEALVASDLPRAQWELIVVDDASRDGAAEVAARLADRVVRLTGRHHGPAVARNRGSRLARGEILIFVDADVCVHPDVLRRFRAALMTEQPAVAAVFGAYDTEPRADGLVSQYRNLLHHYVHLQHPGPAETFWAGCGAVRRDVFLKAGGFDEDRYPRPQIEDIALGYRLREMGYSILLRPEIRATHLKRWTLRSMIVTDIRDRGIPWMKLLLRKRRLLKAPALNVGRREMLCTVLTGLAGLFLVAGAATRSGYPIGGAVLALGGMTGLNLPLLRWFARVRGLTFALLTVPLRVLYYAGTGVAAILGWLQHLREHDAGDRRASSIAADAACRSGR